MTVLTIWSESGGVGKTTTALNLGAALGQTGDDVLLVDLDPQPASLTDHAGYSEVLDDSETTLVDALLEDDVSIEELIITDEKYDLVPGHDDLSTLESQIHSNNISMAEFLLQSALDPVQDQYDYIILDAPATLSKLVDNALIAGRTVLIPMEMTRKGERSLTGVQETVTALETNLQRARPDFELTVLGVVPNRVSGSTLNQEVRAELENDADHEFPILPVAIPDYNVVEHAWEANMDLFDYAEEHGLRVYQEDLLEQYTKLAAVVQEKTEDPTTQTPKVTVDE